MMLDANGEKWVGQTIARVRVHAQTYFPKRALGFLVPHTTRCGFLFGGWGTRRGGEQDPMRIMCVDNLIDQGRDGRALSLGGKSSLWIERVKRVEIVGGRDRRTETNTNCMSDLGLRVSSEWDLRLDVWVNIWTVTKFH